MKLHEWQRDMRIAHLEIHGWEPVVNRGSMRHGIYNEMVGIGFSCRPDGASGDPTVKRWDRSHRRDSYQSCPWHAVTDWHLDTIEERLAEL